MRWNIGRDAKCTFPQISVRCFRSRLIHVEGKEGSDGNIASEISTSTWTQTDIARLPLEPQSWTRLKLDRTDAHLDLIANQPRVVSKRIEDFFREFGIAIIAVILVTMLLLTLRVAMLLL